MTSPAIERADAPILFIHYGPASYLQSTLRCARTTNPEKRIILLGDKANRRSADGVAEFFPFENFSSGEKSARFQQVFQVIQGERHRFSKHGGVEAWLKFVFRRWFLIEEFLKREKINSFWTFDSDTIVMAPLAPRESRFQDVEATTQCRGECLNGWVGSLLLVERYTACMLDLFSDPLFLDAQRERLRANAGLAFNEMDAFSEFCRRENVVTRRASEVLDGEAFDDALAFAEDYERAPDPVLGRIPVKRIWTTPSGGIWAKSGGIPVRLLTCNMSWMPDYLWKKLEACAEKIGKRPILTTGSKGDLREIDLREPLLQQIRRRAAEVVWRFKRRLPRLA
ncbi:MAG: hypothetical protein NTV93_08185 [Verrucomicrobia bacterium]|nr:hypothetical protein [Verrucomicrobiota bacterium]